MPRQRRRGVEARPSTRGSVEPTRVLDWRTDEVAAVAARLGEEPGRSAQDWLRAAHVQISVAVRPVYALDDTQPTSKTLRRGRGSCSQRLAILEALARSHGIATRVEGIAVDGRFWYPRFPRLSWLVPERVILAWPEFRVGGQWLAVGDLFDPEPAATMFTNAGEETLFDAIGRTSVAWHGDCADGVCDLSGHVLESLGYFDDRDVLFATHGQTLCWTARTVGEPVLSRRVAKARTR